jgi:hypothetical protein
MIATTVKMNTLKLIILLYLDFNSVTNLSCETLSVEYKQYASEIEFYEEFNAAEAEKLPTRHAEGRRSYKLLSLMNFS